MGRLPTLKQSNCLKKQPSVGETLGAIRLPSKGRGGPFERIKIVYFYFESTKIILTAI